MAIDKDDSSETAPSHDENRKEIKDLRELVKSLKHDLQFAQADNMTLRSETSDLKIILQQHEVVHEELNLELESTQQKCQELDEAFTVKLQVIANLMTEAENQKEAHGKEIKDIQDATQVSLDSAGREVGRLKEAGDKLMRARDDMAAQLDNLSKLRKIEQSEGLGLKQEITELKKRLDDQTKAATHYLEERDAAKRLAEKAEKELDKAVAENAELRKKIKELEEQAPSSNEPKRDKPKEQDKERNKENEHQDVETFEDKDHPMLLRSPKTRSSKRSNSQEYASAETPPTGSSRRSASDDRTGRGRGSAERNFLFFLYFLFTRDTCEVQSGKNEKNKP